MSTSSPDKSFEGRRLEDTRSGNFPISYEAIKPGDCWKVLEKDGTPVLVTEYSSNLTGFAWMAVAPGPDGLKMFCNLRQHTVREHDDGTISVRSGDGSSNSILVVRRKDERWHGYIEHNIWTSCD